MGVGVSEPSIKAVQGESLPSVRLFFDSPPELQNLSSLKGWAPWVSLLFECVSVSM